MRAHGSGRLPNVPSRRRSRKRTSSPIPPPNGLHNNPTIMMPTAQGRRMPPPPAHPSTAAAISAAARPATAANPAPAPPSVSFSYLQPPPVASPNMSSTAIDMRRHVLAKRIAIAPGGAPVGPVPQGGVASGAIAGGNRDDDLNESPRVYNEISRERFILTGGETGAPIMPSVQMRIAHASKEKPRSRTCWEFVPFENNARKDGLKLKHWQRVGTPAEYAFARLNRPIQMVTYTDEEYSLAIEPVLSLSAHGVRMKPAEPRNPGHASLPPTAQHSRQLAQQLTQQRNYGQHQKGPSSSAQDLSVSSSHFASQRPGSPTATSGAHTRRASAAAAAAAAAASPSTAQPPGKVSEMEKSKSSGALSLSVPGATGGSLRNGMDRVPPQKPWTKFETDELFRLCSEFDLRFIVVHDRWPDSFPERSIDDLKDRYYSVAKALIEFRAKHDPAQSANMHAALHKHCQAIVMNPFDYEYECIRKNQLEWQYRRSKAELREEEETVREARRIEANRRRLVKERQRLAKLLTPAGEFGTGKGVDAALAAAASSATPQKTFPHRKVSTGPFARSSLVFAPVSQSSKVCKRVDAGLEELNVSLRPMPTCTVVDNFDLLRIDILNILELNRTVAKKEEEVYSLRVKLAKAKGEPIPPPPPGVPSSHKKRRLDDVEAGPIFGGRV